MLQVQKRQYDISSGLTDCPHEQVNPDRDALVRIRAESAQVRAARAVLDARWITGLVLNGPLLARFPVFMVPSAFSTENRDAPIMASISRCRWGRRLLHRRQALLAIRIRICIFREVPSFWTMARDYHRLSCIWPRYWSSRGKLFVRAKLLVK